MKWLKWVVIAVCALCPVLRLGSAEDKGSLAKPPLFGITVDELNGVYDPVILKELGVRWQRRSSVDYARVRGKDYSKLDWDAEWKGWEKSGLVYEKDPMYGIRAQGIEILANVNSGSEAPEDIQDYRKYIYHLVDHLANKSGLGIRRFEVSNEPNLKGFWRGSTEEYAEMMRATSEEIHRACPEALISHGSVASGPGWREWFDKVFNYRYADGTKAIDYFDCSDIHLYMPAEGMAEETAEWYRFLNDHGKTIKELWVTEAGMQSRPEGPLASERRQAADVVKRFIVGASARIDALCWFSLQDRIISTEGNIFRYMGLRFVEDRKPVPAPSYNKLSFWSYQHLARLTDGVDWSTIINLYPRGYPQVWGYRVKGKEGEIIFLWRQCRDVMDREEVKFQLDRLSEGKYRLVELVPRGETGSVYKEKAEFAERSVEIGKSFELGLSDAPVALVPVKAE